MQYFPIQRSYKIFIQGQILTHCISSASQKWFKTNIYMRLVISFQHRKNLPSTNSFLQHLLWSHAPQRAKTNKPAVGQITFSLHSKASSNFILSYCFPLEYTALSQYKTKYLLPAWNSIQQFFQHAGTQSSTKPSCIIKQYQVGKLGDRHTKILHPCIFPWV